MQTIVFKTVKISKTSDRTPPLVNAGPNQTKSAEFKQEGSASDSRSGIAFVEWRKFSGPGDVTFVPLKDLSTTISADTDGQYVIRLTATDNAGNSAFSEFTLCWGATSGCEDTDSGGGFGSSTVAIFIVAILAVVFIWFGIRFVIP